MMKSTFPQSDSTIVTLEQQAEWTELPVSPGPVLIDSIRVLRYAGRYDRIYLVMPGMPKLIGSDSNLLGSVVILSRGEDETRSILTSHPLILSAFGDDAKDWQWWIDKSKSDPEVFCIKETDYWTPMGWHDQYEELRLMETGETGPITPTIYHPNRHNLFPMRHAPHARAGDIHEFERRKAVDLGRPVTQDNFLASQIQHTMATRQADRRPSVATVSPSEASSTPPKVAASSKASPKLKDSDKLILPLLKEMAEEGRFIHRKHINAAMEKLAASHPGAKISWPYFITQPTELRADGRRGWFDISSLQ